MVDRKDLILWATTLFHTAFFLFILLAPLVNSNYLLTLHLIFVPFILAHWFTGDNTCAVTLVERGIRRMKDGDEYDDDSCLSCKVIEPVFDFPKYFPKLYKFLIILGLSLWSVTAFKIYNKYKSGEMRSFMDIFVL